MLKTGGGGLVEPMDKMSEKIFDLIPNQFAAIESELVDAFASFLASFVLQLLRLSSNQLPFSKIRTHNILSSLCSIDEDVHLMDTNAIVYTTGDVHWNPVLRLRSPCVVNLEKYPFDEQNCSIEFASNLYHGSHINITYYGTPERSLTMGNYQPNPNWQVLNYRLKFTLPLLLNVISVEIDAFLRARQQRIDTHSKEINVKIIKPIPQCTDEVIFCLESHAS
ncbi:neuronal acetylcholine receptor subunit beta-3 [Plakobranchus ocellatus]|uniref:Neuronal acetylcholine receptor subunit beta-3 n=1 Tax=Plakobranchus ocellatus TaxID=259542 RepID=A0AAV3ZKD0_9GAST|nr:neuronal acetylcholine receptor subunit beta-3 [Plakobranchus ocellatus]